MSITGTFFPAIQIVLDSLVHPGQYLTLEFPAGQDELSFRALSRGLGKGVLHTDNLRDWATKRSQRRVTVTDDVSRFTWGIDQVIDHIGASSGYRVVGVSRLEPRVKVVINAHASGRWKTQLLVVNEQGAPDLETIFFAYGNRLTPESMKAVLGALKGCLAYDQSREFDTLTRELSALNSGYTFTIDVIGGSRH